jgi:hypothetical protein
MIRRIPNKTARHNPKPVIIPIHPILRDMLSVTPLNIRREYPSRLQCEQLLNTGLATNRFVIP